MKKTETTHQEAPQEKQSLVTRIKAYIDRGVEASKKGIKTAGNAISDFGDKSVLQIELSQLKAKLAKEYTSLGEVSYALLTGKTKTVKPTSAKVCDLLPKIAACVKDIKKHEKQIKEMEKDAESKKNEKK